MRIATGERSMKRLFVILLVCGAVSCRERPPDLRVLRAAMASAIPQMRIVVTRDAAGRPVRFRFLPATGAQ
jgi:hypothetical protein